MFEKFTSRLNFITNWLVVELYTFVPTPVLIWCKYLCLYNMQSCGVCNVTWSHTWFSNQAKRFLNLKKECWNQNHKEKYNKLLKIAPGELRKTIVVSKLGSKALLERKHWPTPANTNVMQLLNLWFILNSDFFTKNNKTQRNTGFGYFRNNIELGDFREKTSKGWTVIQLVVWYFEKKSKPWLYIKTISLNFSDNHSYEF